jgi:hypothetical protein
MNPAPFSDEGGDCCADTVFRASPVSEATARLYATLHAFFTRRLAEPYLMLDTRYERSVMPARPSAS